MEKHLTDLERSNIIFLYEINKWSSYKIANELKINVKTVLLWILYFDIISNFWISVNTIYNIILDFLKVILYIFLDRI